MTPTEIDALARLLDGDPTLNGEATEETRALGRLAHYLLETPPLTADPKFKATLRASLVEEARAPARAPSALQRLRTGVRTTTSRWRHSSRVAAATASAALALSGGGMAVAADRALPSDAFYPAKLVLEDVRIAFVRDRADRGEAHLDRAMERVDEAEAVAEQGDQAGAALALREADQSARSGAGELLRVYQDEGNGVAATRLATFTEEQRDRLGGLGLLLDGDAADAARTVVIGLERIEARLLSMTGECPACSGGRPGAGAGFDFTDIPSADEDFQACPCELGTSGNPSEPVVDEAPEPAPAPAPQEPPVTEVTPPGTETPVVEPPVDEPPVDAEPPAPPAEPEMPDVREPLRDTSKGLIEEVVDDVLDLLR